MFGVPFNEVAILLQSTAFYPIGIVLRHAIVQLFAFQMNPLFQKCLVYNRQIYILSPSVRRCNLNLNCQFSHPYFLET